MFRFKITARRAHSVLAMAASLWSSNAAAQACSDCPDDVLAGFFTRPGTPFVDTDRWDFGASGIAMS